MEGSSYSPQEPKEMGGERRKGEIGVPSRCISQSLGESFSDKMMVARTQEDVGKKGDKHTKKGQEIEGKLVYSVCP